MTHEAEHVIIHLATPVDSSKPKGWKVWHCIGLIFALGVIVGLLF